jgi:hypothetical protein
VSVRFSKPLKMVRKIWPDTPARNFHHTLCNIPEKYRSQLSAPCWI